MNYRRLHLNYFFIHLMIFWLFSSANAQSCIEPPSGLMSWWRAEGNATDTIGTNDGIFMNGTLFKTGKVGRAFSFDGLDDLVSVHNASNLNITSSFTIEAWAFRTSATSPMHLVGKREGCGGPPFYQLAIGNGAIPSDSVPLNVWKHLVVTYDADTFYTQHYVNGVVVQNAFTPEYPPGPNSADLLIGNSGSCAPFSGRIDEVSLYNRALTADEINIIYTAGSSGKCAPTPSPVGGSVTGIIPSTGKVTCKNVTTGQSIIITIPKGVRSWNCEEAGLVVSPGNIIRISPVMTGPAQ